MNTVDLEQQIASLSINVVTGAAILLVLLVIATVLLRDRVPKLKPYLFGMLAATLILPTLFFAGSTIYLNVKSDSKGPVHWHAEVEFWACDSELELRNPSAFLSNKIGTSTYHEHDDKHIHLEGVVVRKAEDASLGKFMRVTGGSLSSNAIDVPLNENSATWLTQGEKLDGDPAGSLSINQLENSFIKHTQSGPVAHLANGSQCGTQTAQLQTFVYTFNKDKNTYTQKKIAKPEDYTISEESSLGPPADCVIFDFDTPKDRTDKLCEQYGIRDKNRCQKFGVKEPTSDLCSIEEVDASGGTL